MLSTEEITHEFFNNFFLTGRVCVLKITNKCNVNCDICIESSSPNEFDLMSNDMILEIFKQISNKNLVVAPQGGEALLYPDKCLFIAEQCKKHNLLLGITTNGFWGNDPEFINFVNKKLKPNWLIISIDYWHQKQIPIESIENIVKKINKDIKLFFTTIFNRNHPPNEIKVDPQWFRLNLPMIPLGRALALKEETISEFHNDILSCGYVGFSIESDGLIRSSCPNEHFGCKLGKFPETKLDTLINLRRPLVHFIGNTYGFPEICRKQNIHILDEKWRNPNYIEEINA